MVLHAGVNLVGMCVLPATLPTPLGNNSESETGAQPVMRELHLHAARSMRLYARQGITIKGRTSPALVQCACKVLWLIFACAGLCRG